MHKSGRMVPQSIMSPWKNPERSDNQTTFYVAETPQKSQTSMLHMSHVSTD
mgnify:CR=1 FL=1